MKLDYSIQKPEDRKVFIDKLIAETPNVQLNKNYLDILADYMIFAMTPEEKKEKNILTENRLITINKRECSYQDLVSKFENGEDGLHNLITNDKNVILTPKVSISAADRSEIPPLQSIADAIDILKEEEKKATGKRKFLLKKQLIELCQDQYAVKSSYKPSMYNSNTIKSIAKADLTENITISANGEPISDGIISFFNPKHISALLCNYSLLKEESYGHFEGDCYYMMEDLDELIESTLRDEYPLYYKILIYKIDGRQNAEIQKLIEEEFLVTHSLEYISSLWRNKIPKLLAQEAKKQYIV